MFATAAHGVADLLGQELAALGGTDVRVAGSGVRFHAKPEVVYRACLWSRLANRILMPVLKGPAGDEEALYRLIQSIDWSEYMPVSATLAIDFFTSHSNMTHTLYGAQKVKDAIVDQFRETGGERPSVDRERPDLRVNVYLFRNEARVAIDFSGSSLHRRGYRQGSTRAPIKENLAASMLAKAGWQELATNGGTLYDPMCGSGTLLIEAALMASDTAPGLTRDYFGFTGLKLHDPNLWQELLDEALKRSEAGIKKLKQNGLVIAGADLDKTALEHCRENLVAAGMQDLVSVTHKDFFSGPPDSLAGAKPGLVVFNPPYGERLESGKDMATYMRKLSDSLRHDYSDWKIGVLSPTDAPVHLLRLAPSGEKAAKKRSEDASLSFSNGGIDCKFVLGSVKAKKDSGAIATAGVNSRPADASTPSVWAGKQSVRNLSSKAGKDAATAGQTGSADSAPSMFRNRLSKNRKKLASWVKKNGINVYRLYDADMPEYAVAIDVYRVSEPGDTNTGLSTHAVVQEYRAPASVDPEKARQRLNQVMADTQAELELDAHQIHLKVRKRQKGSEQYEKSDSNSRYHLLDEAGSQLRVNFEDYLDTGLFADSRKIRSYIREHSSGKRFLNLFAYTASATVQSIAGGASHTTSVDSSKTYLDWAKINFELNGIDGVVSESRTSPADKGKEVAHRLVRDDVMTWLESEAKAGSTYDLILLDPPTYSNSRDIDDDWNVQTSYIDCIKRCLALLDSQGTLIFCTNFRRFRFDTSAFTGMEIDIRSDWSVDRDFQRSRKIHQCWFLRHQRTT